MGELMADNRRHWHIDRGISPSAIVTIILFAVGLAGTGALWYQSTETRLSGVEQSVRQFEGRIDRLRASVIESEERSRAAIRAQERRSEKQFDSLRVELAAMRKLLEQLVMNTSTNSQDVIQIDKMPQPSWAGWARLEN